MRLVAALRGAQIVQAVTDSIPIAQA